MDPSIMKLLEEDEEDETMHSGADVEAFTAALNRDIEGDASSSRPSDLDGSELSQGSSLTSSQFISQWQPSLLVEKDSRESQEEQHSHQMETRQQVSDSGNQQQKDDSLQEQNHLPLPPEPSHDASQAFQGEKDGVPGIPSIDEHNHEKNLGNLQDLKGIQNLDNPSQLLKLQRTSNQQSAVAANNQQQTVTAMNSQQSVSMGTTNQQTMASGTSGQQGMGTGLSTEPAVATGTGNQNTLNVLKQGKQVPFAMLLPLITPQLDKDRGMQLQTLYLKLRKNEISKDGFVRHMRSIIGDQMLKMAVYKLQSQAVRNSRMAANQLPVQSQASSQQLVQTTSSVQMSTDSRNLIMDTDAQKFVDMQSDSHGIETSQMSSSSLGPVSQEREHPKFPVQGLNKQQQQHFHFSQASFSKFGSTSNTYHQYSASNVNTSVAPLKQPSQDSQMRPMPPQQSMSTTQSGTTPQSMNMMSVAKFGKQNSIGEVNRLPGGALSHPTVQQSSVQWPSSTSKELKTGIQSSMTHVKPEPFDHLSEQQHRHQFSTPQGLSSFPPPVQIEQGNPTPGTLKDESFETQSSQLGFSTPMSGVPSNSVSSSVPTPVEPNVLITSRTASAISTLGPGNSAKTPLKKPSVGQKKPLEALGSSPPSNKKQKVSGALLDQSIEQLNDVTAVSGVNLREEEEQLFSGPKEDSRVSEASRRVVQEEEERLILQKIPLQKKLAEIMAKCGLKGISSDVERCLSLCVEERMRGLVHNLIRLSKQRLDIEKPRHRTIITSDVRQQIMTLNRKAREEWEKKQAEAEKLQKQNEPEGQTGIEGDKEKDESRVKSFKATKEEDDKMRTTAANVAARAAVGGDDMLSKWQLMAEQARQKREGLEVGSQPSKDAVRKPLATSTKNGRDHQEAEKRGHSTAITTSGGVRKMGRSQVVVPQTRVARSISVRDVIAALEREPQMSKSALIYRLYDKIHSNSVGD